MKFIVISILIFIFVYFVVENIVKLQIKVNFCTLNS